MATMKEINLAIQDDLQTRHPDDSMASMEIRFSHARVCMAEAMDVAVRLEGELIVNDSPEAIARLTKQFDLWSDAWVNLMLGY